LVVREPHPTDGRQVVVRVTAAARRLLRDDRRQREAWLSRQLVGLTASERDLLQRALPHHDPLASA
jgi:DNA-binding MarR family transcriptional regulator